MNTYIAVDDTKLCCQYMNIIIFLSCKFQTGKNNKSLQVDSGLAAVSLNNHQTAATSELI